MVINLYQKIKQENFGPNQMYLDSVLEAGLRTDDSAVVFDAMSDFIRLKKDPHRRLLNQVVNLKHMPDRLYVLLKENYSHKGVL